MNLPIWVGKAALAVVSADAAILTALVDQKVITATQGADIGAIILAVSVGWQGQKIQQARATPIPTTPAPTNDGVTVSVGQHEAPSLPLAG